MTVIDSDNMIISAQDVVAVKRNKALLYVQLFDKEVLLAFKNESQAENRLQEIKKIIIP